MPSASFANLNVREDALALSLPAAWPKTF